MLLNGRELSFRGEVIGGADSELLDGVPPIFSSRLAKKLEEGFAKYGVKNAQHRPATTHYALRRAGKAQRVSLSFSLGFRKHAVELLSRVK